MINACVATILVMAMFFPLLLGKHLHLYPTISGAMLAGWLKVTSWVYFARSHIMK